MNAEEVRAEKNYRYHERVGMMVEDGTPSTDQKERAKEEANQWEQEMKQSEP